MIVACRRARRRIACGIARRRIASRMARRVRYRPSPDRVPSRSSRAVSSVAGSRPGWLVACGIVRRRIACRMARRRIASRRVPARVGDLGIPAVPPVWHPEVSSSAMPRPNSACSRRRHRRFTNIYSFTCLWRSIKSPSAARLRRGVGPLSTPHAVAERSRQRDIIRHIPGISGHIRA